MNRELHTQAKRIFQRVCDLEKGHRTRTLRAICDGDLKVETEVRSLLQVDVDHEPGADAGPGPLPETPESSR